MNSNSNKAVVCKCAQSRFFTRSRSYARLDNSGGMEKSFASFSWWCFTHEKSEEIYSFLIRSSLQFGLSKELQKAKNMREKGRNISEYSSK